MRHLFSPVMGVLLSSLLLTLSALIHANTSSLSKSSLSTLPSNAYLKELQTKAVSLKLAEHPKWKGLMHYHEDRWSSSGYSSYVDDQNFFYTEQGSRDASAELLATLADFFETESLGNDHGQCRFVYRYQWLKEQLSIDSNRLPTADCKDYKQWRSEVNAHSVSLVFPASTLNSPSSMFGHTLLRFDPKDIEQGSDWLSYALNFGANVDSDDNSIFFAYRGLAGGYPGVYNMMRYFEKIKEYNRMENRDMWEYKLNLTPSEVDGILKHVWELKDINFDYFFLDENCSFRLLELIELVRPEVNLTDQFNYAVIPTNTVRVVVEQGLVDDIEFRPSEVSTLRTRIQSLSEEHQALAHALANDIKVLELPAFSSLNSETQGQIVQLAYSYLRYEQRQVRRDKSMAKRSHNLLLALNKLPSETLEIPKPASPETGHETSMISYGIGERNDDFYQQVNYRVNYHDLLDNEKGYLRGAQIMFANAELRHYDDAGWKVNKFELLDINSVSPRNEFLTPLSWRVNMGYERVYSDNDDIGVLQINGGVGHSYEGFGDSVFYGLATGRMEQNKDFEYLIEPAFGADFGWLNNASFGAQRINFGSYKFLNGEYRMKAAFDQNINIAVDHALRFSLGYEWHKDESFGEANMAYRYYF